jgi:hypothetical protein
LGDFLISLVAEHHSQWDHILPQEKLVYNDSLNRSTGQSPFQIVYGMQPRGFSELKDLEQNEFGSASAEDFAEGMKELHNRIKVMQEHRTKRSTCLAKGTTGRADGKKEHVFFYESVLNFEN